MMEKEEIERKIAEKKFLVSRGELSNVDEEKDWTKFYDEIFSRVPIPPGFTLDVGSNSARYSRWLKRRGEARRVVSLDLRQIEKIKNEEIFRGSASKLAFEDNSFDSVVSFFAVPRLLGSGISEKTALSEMVRVARKQVLIWPVPTSWFGIKFILYGTRRSVEDEKNAVKIKEYAENLFKNRKDLNYDVFRLGLTSWGLFSVDLKMSLVIHKS